MVKYSVLAVILAVLIGATIGSTFTNHKAEKQLQHEREQVKKRLQHERDSITKLIFFRDKEILTLHDKVKLDSIHIEGLLFKIQEDGVRTEKKRNEATKFTKDEKIQFILDRYSH